MKRKGFTLIELMVVMAVIGILATMMVPLVTSAINKARISKVVGMAKTLETAVDAYYADTGSYAYEYASGTWTTAWNPATYHQLSYNAANNTAWAGPYIKSPLGAGDNPFGYGKTYNIAMVINSLSGNTYCSNNFGGVDGFDLNGDGIVDRSGSGNLLCLNYVTQTNAQKIDNLFDAGVPGNWTTSGRVKYNPSPSWVASAPDLIIYLSGGA